MLAGKPGARSAAAELAAELAAEPSDARDRALLAPLLSRGPAYLDMKIHLEKNLEEERQILLQQQKVSRNRARKYFVESNRRRKAFEEKLKEQEEREQKIREQILQQRKQKFEEVTEKFQRAHIPLSQRRRAVFQKPIPPLEEALKQIQESSLKSEVNLLSSHRPTVNWRAIDNALALSLSKSNQNHQKYFLSKMGYGKEIKENSSTSLATNKDAFQLKLEETQKLLEDQHLSSLQKFCDEVKQITNSETLSSVDSLEAGEHEQVYLTLNQATSTPILESSFSLNSKNLQSTNVNCFDEDKLSAYKTQHISNWLIHLDESNTQTGIPSSNNLSKLSVLPLHEYCNSKEQDSSAPIMERSTNTTENSVSFTYSPPVLVEGDTNKKAFKTGTMRTTDSSSGTFQKERPLVTESPAFKFSKAWTTPNSITQKLATFSDQEKPSSLAHENRATSFTTPCVAVATPLAFPSNAQSARPFPKNSRYIKGAHPVQCCGKLGESKDLKDEKIQYLNCSDQELSLFSDNGQAAYIPHNSDLKDKKQKTAEIFTASNVISDCDVVGQHKKMKHNIHERNSVRFLKSILKKESKYEHDCFTALVISQGFKLGNKKAATIRDSIELTKERGKGTEIPKTVKKLRWFDETGERENNAADNESLKTRIEASQQGSQPFSIPARSDTISSTLNVPACAVSSERETLRDECASENVSALGGCGTDHVPLNCFMPSGYNSAKQAWSASKKEEVKSPLHKGDSKTQKTNPQRARAKIIRSRSAKVPSGHIYTNRKGTVIRPQSASKVNTFLQAQGKLIVPHPPLKSPLNIRNGKNTQVSQCQSAMPEHFQNIITHNCFNSKHVLPREHKLDQWSQENNLPSSSVHANLITVIPSLSYYSPECQTLAKTDHSSDTQMVDQDGTSHYTQRCSNYEERNDSVTYGTTNEADALWKRQPNTLGQNEKSADSTVTRRKRIIENKQRSLLEKKRQNPGALGQKHSEQMMNFGQSIRPSSVSESTSEFLMAEDLVKGSVAEEEILTVIKSKQLQKPNLASNKTQQVNICSLSAEEEKILQSLNRLNERLYHVQETICKNPSIKNTLQIIPLTNRQPRAGLSPGVGSRLQRKY